ncbi:MAG TPA: hypothetical protein VER55_10200 [Ardenticatenaceae bacterium]|nr:hypothetical protein [Ardenticatenaceae bacterium]
MERFRSPALRMLLATALAVAASVAVLRIGAAVAAEGSPAARAAALRVERLIQHNPGAEQVAPNEVRLKSGAVVSFPMAGVADEKCAYEDLCLFEHANFGGERIRFTFCFLYVLKFDKLSDGRLWSTQVSSFINRHKSGTWAYIWNAGGSAPEAFGSAKWELLNASRASAADAPPQQMASVPWNDRAEIVRPCPSLE